MVPKRVVAFVDGFNLYHAVEESRQSHLKWLDLRNACLIFAPQPQYSLEAVYYFSAYATWRPGPYARHRQYVKALAATGVTPIMGTFKEKQRECRKCGDRWVAHEEKETDVNIALHLFQGAVDNTYDRAFLLSGDSDLVPAVHAVKRRFPEKEIRIIAPANRPNSKELVAAAGGPSKAKKLPVSQLSRCLLPRFVTDTAGAVVARRPIEYDPPS